MEGGTTVTRGGAGSHTPPSGRPQGRGRRGAARQAIAMQPALSHDGNTNAAQAPGLGAGLAVAVAGGPAVTAALAATSRCRC